MVLAHAQPLLESPINSLSKFNINRSGLLRKGVQYDTSQICSNIPGGGGGGGGERPPLSLGGGGRPTRHEARALCPARARGVPPWGYSP